MPAITGAFDCVITERKNRMEGPFHAYVLTRPLNLFTPTIHHSEATKGSLNDECEVENVSQECLDYGAFLDELTTLRDAMTPIGSKHDPMSLADTLGMIKLSAAESSKASGGAELAKALEAAKAATAEHGITSTEAKLAWETYEEIAASGTDNAVGVDLREECSVDAGEEACRAIEELDRVLPVLLAISSFDNRGQFGEGVDKQFEA